MISRQSDIELITEIHNKHKAHGYRWNVRQKYGDDIKSYYDGLNQFLAKIKEEQISEPVILHTDQGSVYSSASYNNLLNDFNIQRSMS